MTHSSFEEYKKAVKSKYEAEKSGPYSSFLSQPSRANLRKLCAERFNGTSSVEDLATFKLFFRFEFAEGYNKLKNETGRFRSMENFFKGETNTSDIEMINLAAILVDFTPRPFRKFSRNHQQVSVEKEIERKENYQEEPRNDKMTNRKTNSLRRILMGALVILGITVGGYATLNLISPEKQCMQWHKDHYERMDCQSEINVLYSEAPIIPFDEDLYELNKLTITDTTTFFKGGKPIVWYCKMNANTIECFDDAGFHPITNKALRPITGYIIGKYLIKK